MNSVFRSISPQDAVPKGEFLVSHKRDDETRSLARPMWDGLLQSPFAGFLLVAVLLIDLLFFNPGR